MRRIHYPFEFIGRVMIGVMKIVFNLVMIAWHLLTRPSQRRAFIFYQWREQTGRSEDEARPGYAWRQEQRAPRWNEPGYVEDEED